MNTNTTYLMIIFGIALFAMFFGAGNFVLPPSIGASVGSSWLEAWIGFGSSAILAPFLGIIAVVLSGKNFSDLGERINPTLTTILATIIILCIGPLLAIPRTGATLFEIGVKPVYEEASAIWTSVLYFIAVFILSLSPSKIVDVIGKYLTPLLVLILFAFIIAGVFYSGDLSDVSVSSATAMTNSFTEGYLTMDVLASVFFAGLLIQAARNKGFVSNQDKQKIVIGAAAIAAGLMLLIYGGLIYLGAHSGTEVVNMNKSELLLNISTNLFGDFGPLLMSLSMLLACLTTSVALTASFAYFFARLTNNKLGYHEGVITCTIVSVVLSISSIDEMFGYAAGVLTFIYPVVLVMVLFVLIFGKYVSSRTPYIVAVITVSVFSLISLLSDEKYNLDAFKDLRDNLPLHTLNVEWFLPSLLAFIIAAFMVPNDLKRV